MATARRVIQGGKAVPFAKGLDDPKGMAAFQGWLFVADKQKVWKIDQKGKADLFAPVNAFPKPPRFLNDLVVDPESGIVYVSDSGDLKGKGGAVYRITPQGVVTVVADTARWPELKIPNGLAMDGASHLLLADFGSGELHRIKLADGTHEKLADGLGSPDGLAWDKFGQAVHHRLEGRQGLRHCPARRQAGADCRGLRGSGRPVPRCHRQVPARARHEGRHRHRHPRADPRCRSGRDAVAPGNGRGLPRPEMGRLEGRQRKGRDRPVPSHPADPCRRRQQPRLRRRRSRASSTFSPTIRRRPKSQVFLDMQDRVSYNDNQNEEGFLGLAFHPKFKTNGEFFVFYTVKKPKLTNVVSRFRVRKDDPNKADPASEEELLRFTKPFWNHDGGTLCFGPDGYLYITHGDGGAANDPYDNGQNLTNHLGKVLRIDVDRKENGKNYAIPKDNPFVGKKDAQPEIWAYGLRNVWRMAFDRKTGKLWAADVGQNLYEEINLIEKGGNYGWNRREGLHPFGARGTGPRKEFIDPIWEYHHDIGKSITGGSVYRGKQLPELDGLYLYGDYVTGKIWALRYDDAKKRVVANRPIRDRTLPIYSFGEDEQGEVYFLTQTLSGQGIFRFVRTK